MINRLWMTAILAALTAPALATEAPDGAPPSSFPQVAAGYETAASTCAACHNIEAGGKVSPNPNATPFQVVSDTAGMNEQALSVWLTSFHPQRTMPPIPLTEEERRNVIAYILSLGPNALAPFDQAQER